MQVVHQTTVSITVGPEGGEDDVDIQVRLLCNIYPGCPETPPAYDHGGLPAEPASVELLSFEIADGKGGWQKPIYVTGPGQYEDDGAIEAAVEKWLEDNEGEVLEAWADKEQADREDAAEMHAERLREERHESLSP